MKSQKIIAIVLILFVAVSIVFLAANFNSTIKSQESPLDVKEPNSPEVLVYYIHNNTRCINCIRFEKYTKDVINEVFADEVKQGRLAFKMANYEEKENNHYVDDYKLVTKAVIVAKTKDGKQTDWKNLTKIWELVNDEAAFKKYIANEVADYLGAN